MVKKEMKEVKIVSLSVKGLGSATKGAVVDLKDLVKKYTKKLFGWLHKKLTELENFLLKKLDEYGKKAADKLEVRLNGS